MKGTWIREIADTRELVQNKNHEDQGGVSLWGQSNQYDYTGHLVNMVINSKKKVQFNDTIGYMTT